jgi:hypothetical protein
LHSTRRPRSADRVHMLLSRASVVFGMLGLLLAAATAAAQAHDDAIKDGTPALAAPAERPLAELITVEVGATCLELDRLTLRIARWRERDTVDSRIRVEVHGDPSSATRVSFTVTAGGASAQRTLADAPEDCDQFHSAVALAIALSIDATLMDPRAQREAQLPVPEVAPAPKAQETRLPQLQRAVQPSASEPKLAQQKHLELAAFAGPSVRVLRGTTLAFAPRAMLSVLPWLSVSMFGYVTQATGLRVGTTPGTVDSTLALGGLELCAGGEAVDRFEVYGCAGMRLGALHHEGKGFMPNFRDTNPWSAVGGALEVRTWIATTVAVGVSVEALVPLAKYEILVSGLRGSASQTSTFPGFGVNVALGPVFRFF